VAVLSLAALVAQPSGASAATTTWPQFMFNAAHTGFNTAETIVNRQTVTNLSQEYQAQGPADADFGSISGSSPAVVGNTAYVGTGSGHLLALPATGCPGGSDLCGPRWTATLSNGVFSSPAVSNGVVYVATAGDAEFGKLYAFRAAGCGHASCTPLWTAVNPNVGSSPTVSGGVVYIASSDGKLNAFAAGGCGRATCTPLWRGTIGTSGEAAPAVAGGLVFAASQTRLFAFRAAGCGRATCSPTWRSITLNGLILNAGPAVSRGVVYIGSTNTEPPETTGTLYAFTASGCGASTCRPRWIAHPLGGDGVNTTPAVANGVVYTSGTTGLFAFDANGCGRAVCDFLWLGLLDGFVSGSEGAPAVAGGVVYYDQNNGHIGAFDARGCGERLCTQLWSSIVSSVTSILTSPVIVNGRLYVAGSLAGQIPTVFVYRPIS
jgi:outer membrane protein assembly factor BamB